MPSCYMTVWWSQTSFKTGTVNSSCIDPWFAGDDVKFTIELKRHKEKL